VDRIAIAKAGVRRCFERRHEGRYAFMPYADAVRHCRKWICCLRELENENRRLQKSGSVKAIQDRTTTHAETSQQPSVPANAVLSRPAAGGNNE